MDYTKTQISNLLFSSELEQKIREGVSIEVSFPNELPPLPKRYRWELDDGGVFIPPKMTHWYRLWKTDFGYMPRAE